MTTLQALTTALVEHVGAALDVTAVDWPTLTPPVPGVVIHPGGPSGTFATNDGGGTWELSYSLVTFQAVAEERAAMHAWMAWVETMRTALDDFTTDDGDVSDVVVTRALEPRVVSLGQGTPAMAGQFDITLTISDC